MRGTLDSDTPPNGALRRLGPRECLALLRTASLGRVMYVVAGVPRAQPVAFTVHDGAVLMTTSADSGLAAAVAGGSVLAFEIDETHLRTRTGWSVVVTGVAGTVGEPDSETTVAAGRIRPWVTGHDQLLLRLPCTRLSGRVVTPRPAGVRQAA